MRKEPCKYCGIIVIRKGNPKSKFLYCSRICKGRYEGPTKTGKNNPNFKNKIKPLPKIRKGIPHSEKTKFKIGIKSKAKFTPEYIEKIRLKYEENGIWIPLQQKTDFQIYYKESNWIERMWDIIPDPYNLIESFGIFNPVKNSKGVVRDHKIGRKYGFQNGIFPEILRHPCNCDILTHSDNVKKKSNRYIDKNSISLDELIASIKCYTKEWKEQEKALIRIKEYENGQRWTNKYKKKT